MHKKILFLLISCIVIFSGLAYGSDYDQVIVYYFYGNFRCASCRKIEQYTKEAVKEFFKDELNSGELVFELVNIDDSENHHFVDDYQLYTKSVIVSLMGGGKEIKHENLVKVWEYLGNKQKFFEYIKKEIEKFLSKLQENM